MDCMGGGVRGSGLLEHVALRSPSTSQQQHAPPLGMAASRRRTRGCVHETLNSQVAARAKALQGAGCILQQSRHACVRALLAAGLIGRGAQVGDAGLKGLHLRVQGGDEGNRSGYGGAGREQ